MWPQLGQPHASLGPTPRTSWATETELSIERKRKRRQRNLKDEWKRTKYVSNMPYKIKERVRRKLEGGKGKGEIM